MPMFQLEKQMSGPVLWAASGGDSDLILFVTSTNSADEVPQTVDTLWGDEFSAEALEDLEITPWLMTAWTEGE